MSLINGVVIGLVTDVEDPEKQGRVKVTFPWLADNHVTDWIRIATLMGGSGRGSFFMPEVKDEVLVAFDHGDARFPYVVGFMWNGQDKPPNDDIDTKVRRLKTVSGHIIEFDDRANTEHVLVKTKGGHHLRLDDASGSTKIELYDQQSQNTLLIDTDQNAIEVTSKVGNITLKAPNGKITLDAMQIDVTSTTSTSIKADTTIEISAQATMDISAQASMEITSQGELELSASAMATLESSGILSLSGSLIKLN